MRSKGRRQGRFVSLSGLKKLAPPPGSSYPLLIVDTSGLPVFPLCEWYRRKKADDTGRTPDTYLEMLQPYFGFLLIKKYAWNHPPDRIRAYLVEFLRTDVGCHVGPGKQDGYLVETTGVSPLSKSSLGVLLAALTSLYDVLADAGYYGYSNPMRSERLAALKQEHLRQVKNVGAPDHAGIRGESHKATNQAYSTAFFRQKRGKVWTPEVVMEPEAVQDRMRQSIDYMISHATFQRDKVILLLLRQTGARLSEIIEMTAGGWRSAGHMGRALVKNKGSRGREEKLIYFTDVIEEQLHTYVQTERAEYDPKGRKRLDQLADEEPLFLTEDGKPYHRSAFYYHWAKLFESSQKQLKRQERVLFSPHDIRHLRVTRGITTIKQKAEGDREQTEELLDGFWRLMGWHSSQTMEIYTHTMSQRQALLEVMLDEEGQKPEGEPSGDDVPQNQASSPQSQNSQIVPTEELLVHADDEFCWYEEE